MADYKVTDSELISIADAIREKGDTSEQLAFPSGFITAIGNLDSSGGSGWPVRYYTPIIQSPATGVIGSILVCGPFATLTCRIHQNSYPQSSFHTILVIPEEIRPFAYDNCYVELAGNGGTTTKSYVRIANNSEIQTNYSGSYLYFSISWFIAKNTREIVTHDTSIVNSVEGGISIFDNVARLCCKLNLSISGASWRNNIVTIPSDLTPGTEFPIMGFTSAGSAEYATYSGSGYYIKDCTIHGDTGAVDIYLDSSYGGQYAYLLMDWILDT